MSKPTKKTNWPVIGAIAVIIVLAIMVFQKGQNRETARAREKAAQDSIAKMEAHVKDSIDAKKERIRNENLGPALAKLSKTEDDMRELTFYKDPSTTKYIDQNSIHGYLVTDDGKNFTLRLKVQYSADDWLFIQRYIIKTDSQTTTYTLLSGTETDVISGGGIVEWIDVVAGETELDILQSIANAKEAKIRYEGKQYYKDRVITNKEKVAIRNVLEAYKWAN